MFRLESLLFLSVGAVLSFGVAAVYYISVAPEAYQEVTKMRVSPELDGPIERGQALSADAIVPFRFFVPTANETDDLAFMLDHTPALVNAVTTQPLTQTLEPGSLLESRFFEVAPPEAFALRIAPGNRAFSISVTGAASVMNFIVPGSRVDVFGAVDVTGSDASRAQVLLDGVEVMAIDEITSLSDVDDGALQTRSITVQAAPAVIQSYLEKAERLRGSPLVVLRGRSD